MSRCEGEALISTHQCARLVGGPRALCPHNKWDAMNLGDRVRLTVRRGLGPPRRAWARRTVPERTGYALRRVGSNPTWPLGWETQDLGCQTRHTTLAEVDVCSRDHPNLAVRVCSVSGRNPLHGVVPASCNIGAAAHIDRTPVGGWRGRPQSPASGAAVPSLCRVRHGRRV